MRYWRRVIRYGGNPEHKRHPGDFALAAPLGPRPGKTLGDGVRIFSRAEALRLLREGVKRGLISAHMRRGYPKNLWAVSDQGTALEATLDNEITGTHHGDPMPALDSFAQKILQRWSNQA